MIDLDISEVEEQAFVGVSFYDKVIFNIVERDAEFANTGLSIIHHLKRDKNMFIARIIESQSYDSIVIFDDKIFFNDFYDITNENKESFVDVIKLIEEDNIYNYFYILDLETNKLIIKIPEIDNIFALDYTNSSDVRDIINIL